MSPLEFSIVAEAWREGAQMNQKRDIALAWRIADFVSVSVFGKLPHELPWVANDEQERQYFAACDRFVQQSGLERRFPAAKEIGKSLEADVILYGNFDAQGIDLAKQTKIRITWHTGEPGASIPATRARIEAAYGARAFDLPGLTEIAAWGFECDARSGLVHVHEDYVYPEILDEQDYPVESVE